MGCERRRPRPRTSGLEDLSRSLELAKAERVIVPPRPKTVESRSCLQSSSVEEAVAQRPKTSGPSEESKSFQQVAEQDRASQNKDSRNDTLAAPVEKSETSPSGALQTSTVSHVATSDQTFSNTNVQDSVLSPKAQHGRALFLSAVYDGTASESPEFDGQRLLQPH